MTSYKNEMFKRRDYYTYDSNGLLQKSRYEGWPGYPYFTETGSLTFSRDTSGLITGITGDKELGAAYDQDLQITSINHILPQPFAEGYTYDNNGNRLSSLTNSFNYDDLNRLTDSTTHDYTYDADGNLVQEKNKLTSETKKYYYDAENRMIKFEHQISDISPIAITATYKYDIFGRRLQKNVNGAITNFFWENDTMTYELNDQYQPIRKYLTSLGMDSYEGHLEYSEITDFPHIFFPDYRQPWYSYMKDQVGTIYKVHSMKTRSIEDIRTYDTFGNQVNQTGTIKTPLGFQGKYYDAESGLNYFYHRYYNPAIGRFTTEDPIGMRGGLNFYKFASNSSIQKRDPFGLISGELSWPPKIIYDRWPCSWITGGDKGYFYPHFRIGHKCECKDGKWKIDFSLSQSSEIIINLECNDRINIMVHEFRHAADYYDFYYKQYINLAYLEISSFGSRDECEAFANRIYKEFGRELMNVQKQTRKDID